MKSKNICIARKCYFSSGVKRPGEGDCGYNYCFEVYINGPIEPVSGLVINLTDVKKVLNNVSQVFNQKHINYDLKPPLKDYSLSSIHQYIHDKFNDEFNLLNLSDIQFVKSQLNEGHELSSVINENP